MNIKPVTTKVVGHQLEIGGVLATDLAKEYGTPLYVLDYDTIASNCNQYTDTFKTHYPNTTVLYASKAGLTIGIAKVIHKLGLGFDVVSGGEIFTVLQAGVNTEQVYFHGNNKAEDELTLAISNGIRIIIDNHHEIELIESICERKNLIAHVMLRLKPEIEAHTHDYIKTCQIDSKFGIEKESMIPTIKRLSDHPKLHFLGIHAHIGSQIFDITPFEDLAEIMTQHILTIQNELGMTVEELNVGGGIGISYTPKDDPPEISMVLEKMISHLKDKLDAHNIPHPKLLVEPGRSTIATAGVTLYTVGAIKEIPGIKDYVFVDGGMADNPRPIMYQAEYTFDLANKMNTNHHQPYTIAGKFCESGDILGKDISLPQAEHGDLLVVYGTGAYNYSMASNYNRFCRPSMVLVQDGKSQCIVKRETYDDLIQYDIR